MKKKQAPLSSITIDESVKDSLAAQRASSCSSRQSPSPEGPIKHYRSGKKHLKITPKKGHTMDTCATIHDTYVCCNVKVLKTVSNCPFDCSYCFLQNYLNDGKLSAIGDLDAVIEEVKEKLEAQPWRFFRIGTWELGDSLALEKMTGQAEYLIKAFRTLPNAILELKTKSDCVDTILDLDHQQKTVVSWSMNTDTIIRKQEHKTASLEDRLSAIKKVSDAGYLLGFHFDPMIDYPNAAAEYDDLVDALFSLVPISQVAWISMGSLRFNPEMKHKMEENFPASVLTAAEMSLGPDKKLRYPKPTRLAMYDALYKKLLTYNAHESLIYLCMERWDVWEHVMGYSPTSIGHLDFLFAESMKKRYPHLVLNTPDQTLYERYQDT